MSQAQLDKQLNKVIRRAQEYAELGIPRPAWVQKQVDAVYLMETDYEAGLALLVDACQDGQTALEGLVDGQLSDL